MIATAAGWVSRPDRGRLRFGGPDAAAFLHAQVSNDVLALGEGGGVYTTYLTPQARLLADMAVYRTADHLLADVPASQAPSLAARFDQLVFAEDVQVEDVSQSIHQFTVVGAAADAAVARASGLDHSLVAALPVRSHASANGVRVSRTDDSTLPSFDLFVPAEASAAVTARLARDGGAAEISRDLFDALRIEAGRPAFGVDMTTETIPLEAGLLERAISQSKGCYVGQEVIVRVLHRGAGRVAKRLVRLAFPLGAGTAPPAGTSLADGVHDVGRITSAAFSPHAGRVVALGYVARDAAEVGKRLRAGAVNQEVEIVGMAG